MRKGTAEWKRRMMGRVRYNQHGYVGQSMSVRAEHAYADGLMPKSKWSKAAMLHTLRDALDRMDITGTMKDDALARAHMMGKTQLFQSLFDAKEWHHTGKYANATDFYGIDSDRLDTFVYGSEENYEQAQLEQARLDTEHRSEQARRIADGLATQITDADNHGVEWLTDLAHSIDGNHHVDLNWAQYDGNGHSGDVTLTITMMDDRVPDDFTVRWIVERERSFVAVDTAQEVADMLFAGERRSYMVRVPREHAAELIDWELTRIHDGWADRKETDSE